MQNITSEPFRPLNYKGSYPCSKQNTKLLTMDWIQMHVKIPVIYEKSTIHEKNIVNADTFNLFSDHRFIVTDSNKRTIHYKKLYYVFQNVEGIEIKIGEIQCLPHVSFISPDSAILKLENRILYYENYLTIIQDLLDSLNLRFVNYSRLDFALDFNYFDNNISPVDFIGNIAASRWVFSGRKTQTHFGQIESSEFNEFSLHTIGRNYNALKLGSRKSPVTLQLYNKTKEMLKKASKPWIREFWDTNNLKDDTNDIWRLEFTLRKSDKSLLDYETGECIDWTDINLIQSNNLSKIYSSLLNQHFQVAEKDESNLKKQFCRLQIVSLFNDIINTCALKVVNLKTQSTNYVKYRISKLVESIEDYAEKQHVNLTQWLIIHVDHIVHDHDLRAWFYYKFGNFEKLRL